MKKLLLIAGSLFVFTLFGASKTNKIVKALEQMQIRLTGISDLSINWNNLTLQGRINLQLFNVTNTPIPEISV